MADNVTIATGDVVRAVDDGGIKYQVMVPHQKNRSDTFTVAANGTIVDCTTIPVGKFTMQVKGSGAAPTSWSVVLEGSLNGTQFTTIIEHSNVNADADGGTKYLGLAAPVKYFRSRCVSIVLGSATNIVVNILGEAGG